MSATEFTLVSRPADLPAGPDLLAALCSPLDRAPTRYRPPPELADHLAVRDVTCRFPTCHHPARDCDIDHRRPFGAGGSTGAGNTWSLHVGHHLGKTHHGFAVRVDETSGVVWWITPAGCTYPVDPEVVGLIAPTSGATSGDDHDGAPF